MNDEILFQQIIDRFDRIEEKIDRLVERTVENSTSITWIKIVGSMITTALLTACGWLVSKNL